MRTRGYTLLLSILVSSVVLAVGVSLLNIVQKELILASIGENSQYAFYAADSGWECAFFWHIKNPNDAQSVSFFEGGQGPAKCGGNTITGTSFTLDFDNGSCANVTVDLSGSNVVIESLGYRYGSASNCPAEHPRQVERAIRATLQ